MLFVLKHLYSLWLTILKDYQIFPNSKILSKKWRISSFTFFHFFSIFSLLQKKIINSSLNLWFFIYCIPIIFYLFTSIFLFVGQSLLQYQRFARFSFAIFSPFLMILHLYDFRYLFIFCYFYLFRYYLSYFNKLLFLYSTSIHLFYLNSISFASSFLIFY